MTERALCSGFGAGSDIAPDCSLWHLLPMNIVPDQSKNWTTNGQNDPFDYWREVVCQAFTKLSPEQNQKTPFAGEIRLTDFDELGSLARITSAPQIVNRLERDVADHPCDSVFVNFQLTGTSIVSQKGIKAKLHPGDFVMLDARQPFQMEFGEYFRQACLHLPIEVLEPTGLELDSVIARTAKGTHNTVAALRDGLNSLLNDDGLIEDKHHIPHLLRLCFEHPENRPLSDQHLALIQQFMTRNCSDPSLTPMRVAAHFRISVRYLHKLFARSSSSFNRFLIRKRLQKARLQLLSQLECPITDIAFDNGFKSGSHFTRSFTAEFGTTPSLMRNSTRLQ